MSGELTRFYHFGPFRLDVTQHLLFRHDTVVALAPKAFETLMMLVRNHGRLVEKGELLKTVWPDTFVEEAILSQNVLTIRKALGIGQKGADKYIQTIPKRGYRFVARVTELNEKDARIQAGRSTTLLQNIKVDGAYGLDRQIESLAVLPMFNASADPNAEYLCEGFSESLINTLSLLPDLKVKACSTLVRYEREKVDPQVVGRELGVDAVLMGKVVSFGESLIVNVELVEVAHGWQLWGQQYNEQPDYVCKIQADIATQVSTALRLKLENVEWTRLARQTPQSAEAYRLYLMGRSFLNKRTTLGYEQAIEVFKKAIELDPDYPLAYSGLADSYIFYDFYGIRPPWQTIPNARAAAARAVALGPGFAEVHCTLGSLKLVFDRDPTGAEREFKRAIELNPRYARAHDGYSQCLIEMNLMWEAMAECKIALELMPFDLEINMHLAWHYLFLRQYDQAIEQLNKTLEMGPDFYRARLLLAMAYEQNGAYPEAIVEFHRARQLEDGPVLSGFLGYTYAIMGRQAEALALLANLIEQEKQSYVPPHSIALIYMGLANRDAALEWLQKADVEHSHWRGWLKLTPELETLHADERFTDLLERIREGTGTGTTQG